MERRLAGSERLLACFDYDGTLAPLRERPEEVETPPAIAAALAELAAEPGTRVAVVSGRRLRELRSRLPAGLWLVGCHGLELEGPEGGGESLVAGGSEVVAAAAMAPVGA